MLKSVSMGLNPSYAQWGVPKGSILGHFSRVTSMSSHVHENTDVHISAGNAITAENRAKKQLSGSREPAARCTAAIRCWQPAAAASGAAFHTTRSNYTRRAATEARWAWTSPRWCTHWLTISPPALHVVQLSLLLCCVSVGQFNQQLCWDATFTFVPYLDVHWILSPFDQIKSLKWFKVVPCCSQQASPADPLAPVPGLQL